MKLNHANLCTRDVASLSRIFSHHFGFEVMQEGGSFAMLRGPDGFSLVLMKMGDAGSPAYPASFVTGIGFHVGFMVDTLDEVHAKHKELSESGCRPGPINCFDAMGATWTAFYCPVGDGIDIEVTFHT